MKPPQGLTTQFSAPRSCKPVFPVRKYEQVLLQSLTMGRIKEGDYL